MAKKMVNFDPGMSDRKVERLARQGRLETRMQREMDIDNGTAPQLKNSPKPRAWQVWTPATWAEQAGVTPTKDIVVGDFNPEEDCAKYAAAGFTVLVDKETGNIDVVGGDGKKVAQYTPQFDYTNKRSWED